MLYHNQSLLQTSFNNCYHRFREGFKIPTVKIPAIKIPTVGILIGSVGILISFFTICSLSALARPLPSACFWFPSAVKNLMDLQCLYWKGLYPVHALVSTKSFYRRVHIQKAFLQCGKAYESSRRWFWLNICHKFFNVCAIRALTQQMLS